MATLPDVAVTGTVIEAAWGNDVRAAVTENPAYLAAAQGDLFRATGAGAIERFASSGPGVLAAASAGALPAWATGSALQLPRVNSGGNGIEFADPSDVLSAWAHLGSGQISGSDADAITIQNFGNYRNLRLYFNIDFALGGNTLRVHFNNATANNPYEYSWLRNAAGTLTDGGTGGAARIVVTDGWGSTGGQFFGWLDIAGSTPFTSNNLRNAYFSGKIVSGSGYQDIGGFASDWGNSVYFDRITRIDITCSNTGGGMRVGSWWTLFGSDS